MKQKKGFELRKVGSQNIVVAKGADNIDFNKIVSMNGSSSFLWNSLIDKTFDLDYVANLLIEHYHIDAETAKNDAEYIISQWQKVGLIE